MRKFRIFFTDTLLLLLLLYTLLNPELTVYGLGQGRGQLKIILNAEPIPELISEGKFTSAEIEKLKIVESVKKFSVDSLNYNASQNYSTYYDQQGKPLLVIVTASKPFKLEAYEWKFPYLGSVSYKGYFDSLKAFKEYQKMRLSGLDADIGRVNAWSTLGWFRDPVFSEMLKMQRGDLAELLFHELFHGTIYAKSSVDLNENLADFIAHKATLLYFKTDTVTLSQYIKSYEEDKRFDKFIFTCISKLDSLYDSFTKKTISEKEMRLKKIKLLIKFGAEMKMSFDFSEKRKQRMADRFLNSGNAYFMHYKRYGGLNDSLENVYRTKYKSSLPLMIKGLKAEIKSL